MNYIIFLGLIVSGRFSIGDEHNSVSYGTRFPVIIKSTSEELNPAAINLPNINFNIGTPAPVVIQDPVSGITTIQLLAGQNINMTSQVINNEIITKYTSENKYSDPICSLKGTILPCNAQPAPVSDKKGTSTEIMSKNQELGNHEKTNSKDLPSDQDGLDSNYQPNELDPSPAEELTNFQFNIVDSEIVVD